MGQNHGENKETRVTTRNDIKKYKVDWILDMSDAYTPEIFPHLIFPHFLQNMGNVTDNINAMNAAIEIDKERIERENFHWMKWGRGSRSWADLPPSGMDTSEYSHMFNTWSDSMSNATER